MMGAVDDRYRVDLDIPQLFDTALHRRLAGTKGTGLMQAMGR
jgi:hypothetical protein